MALDPKYLAAFIDGGIRHRVLGVTLRRFCPWHLFLLQAIESPFLSKGSVTLFDLKTAVGICRLRFDDSRIVRPRWPIWISKKSLIRQVNRFIAYAGDYLSRPEYNVADGPSFKSPPKSLGSAPEILALVSDLIDFGTWTEAEVWEMPMSRAHWYRPMALRVRGVPIDFSTDEELEFQEQMKGSGMAFRKKGTK